MLAFGHTWQKDTILTHEIKAECLYLLQGPDQIRFANCQQGVSLVKDYEEDKSILRIYIIGHDACVELY